MINLKLTPEEASTLLAALQDPEIFGSWASDIERIKIKLQTAVQRPRSF